MGSVGNYSTIQYGVLPVIRLISKIEYIKNRLAEARSPYYALSQPDLIEFINGDGISLLDSSFVGKYVTINNVYAGTFQIADINHDGATNTIDLIPTTQVGNMEFSSANNTYENSTVDTWLNSTYYNSFESGIKNIMKNMSVKVGSSLIAGTTITRKVKLLSCVEMNYSTFNNNMPGYNNYKEGNPYPIFTRGAYTAAVSNRWRGKGSYGNTSAYWLRSRYLGNISQAWDVNSSGYGRGYSSCDYKFGVLPVIRSGKYFICISQLQLTPPAIISLVHIFILDQS